MTMTNERIETERAIFERWVKETKPQLWPNAAADGSYTNPDGSYVNVGLQRMWLGWQAALSRSSNSETAIGALADIAFSDDMTLKVARTKAHRIYGKLRANDLEEERAEEADPATAGSTVIEVLQRERDAMKRERDELRQALRHSPKFV